MLKKALISIAAAMAAGAAAEAAPLTGQQLSATNTFGDIAPNPATIGAGADFTVTLSGTDWFTIDFTEDGLVTVQLVLDTAHLGHGAIHDLSFSDINGTIADIVGFNLISASGVTGITQSDLGFGANSISMSIGADTEWDSGAFFTAQMLFGVDVPLPAAAPLFIGGLGVLGWAYRRRRRSAR